jgi:hypothetical protein
MSGTHILRNPLEGSLCLSCKYRISRVIIPFNETEYGIDRELMDIDDDVDIIYEHHLCEETAIELDHVVMECNRYKNIKGNLVNIDL